MHWVTGLYLEKRYLQKNPNFKLLSPPYFTHLGFKPKNNPPDVYQLMGGELSGKNHSDFKRKQVYKGENARAGPTLLIPTAWHWVREKTR